ncbi:ABC transporter substrate-binding protein [Clostridium algidicarnis]|uniref:ABC transporter substrate-binding protein n=1 Tax=Clostridium algidicarnis TaxID=37659 RepID=UPI001C0DF5C9|nr:ABC transporter substrate-binding protein [Clostridium algidicarnis]MBU3197441.1 ABC transporter substrate-binding protein [Clostridium algidicarnis]MBU3228127.1 ABC transporter substrate-binding protein [Clostridium algidicarnis]MBU3252011.1 ABC transporter substrate-binding protein [Clostridium algidicarnis]
MKRSSSILALLLSGVLTLGLFGCGKKPSSDVPNTDETKKESTLNIVATSEDYKPLFEKFTEETGTKVEFLSMSSGEVISKVKAENGKPMADVWFGGGIDAFMQAKDDNLLEKCEFEGSNDLSPEFKDEDNYWFSKGLTVVGFIVNNDVLKEKNLPEPKSWKDLTNPVYKDEILMSNPAISGTNYAVLNSLIQTLGEEAGWKYFEELNKNIPYYSKRGKDPNVKTVAGEVAIGITYIDKSLESLEKEKNAKLIYPEDGIPWVPEGVAVFKNAKNPEAAKEFMTWVFKDENLKEISKIDNKDTVKIIKPNLQGVELTFPKDKLLKQDISLFGKQRKEMLEKWSALVGDK